MRRFHSLPPRTRPRVIPRGPDIPSGPDNPGGPDNSLSGLRSNKRSAASRAVEKRSSTNRETAATFPRASGLPSKIQNPKPKTLLLLVLAISFARASSTVPLDASHSVHFLDRAAAAEAIVTEESDPFFKSLSTIDIEARLGQSTTGLARDLAVRLLKDRFRSAVQDWTPDEIEMLSASCRRVLQRSLELCPDFVPKDWKFIKTDGSEEGGAAYTRADAIILPFSKLQAAGAFSGPGRLDRLVAHETCHVYCRRHPGVRTRLFERLGFSFVGPILVGDALAPRILTNPDGPVVDSVIRLRRPDGGEFDAAMVLYSPVEHIGEDKGRGVLPYLRYAFFEVRQTSDGWRLVAQPGQAPVGYKVNEVSGFFEKVGRNTSYFISPDEILAENVSIGLTASGQSQIANPEIPRDLLDIIRRASSSGD